MTAVTPEGSSGQWMESDGSGWPAGATWNPAKGMLSGPSSFPADGQVLIRN